MLLAELAVIIKNNLRALTHEELRAKAVQKNKVFGPVYLKTSWVKHFTLYDELISKINKAKIMKFLMEEPNRFHPYLVAESTKELSLLLMNNHSRLRCTILSSIFPLFLGSGIWAE